MKRKKLCIIGMGILIYVLFLKVIINTVLRCSRALFESRRVNAINRTMFHWISNGVDSEFFQSYFSKRRIKRIAIYGTASLGELFFYSMKNTDIEIAYLMDKSAGLEGSIGGIPIYPVDTNNTLPEVDAIVVTPIFFYDSIADELQSRNIPTKKIISLERIVSV